MFPVANLNSRPLSFTFRVDDIAQETDETLRLQLSVSNFFGGRLNDNAFFLDTLDLVIEDSDGKFLAFRIEELT